jgi:hypothetical protein
MPASYLHPDASLDEVRDDLVFLRHRLRRDPRAADLAKSVAALLDQWPAVHAAALAHNDARTEAQGDVGLADDALDARVDAFDNDARHVVAGDRTSPLYELYFPVSPSELKRPVLGDELDTLRDWAKHLKTEESAALRAHAKLLTAELGAADAAVQARDAADAANAAFRATGAYAKYIQKVHATRDRVWSELELRRAKLPAGTPRDWASGFFRPRRQAAPTADELAARAAAKEARRGLAQQRKEAAAKLREARQTVTALKKKKP